MNSCIVLYRSPSGVVRAVTHEPPAHTQMREFANRDEAIGFAEHAKELWTVPYQIVELDEL